MVNPLLSGCPPPRNTIEEETSGSFDTTAISCCTLRFISSKEMSWEASVMPLIRLVSSCGKKPLGSTT